MAIHVFGGVICNSSNELRQKNTGKQVQINNEKTDH